MGCFVPGYFPFKFVNSKKLGFKLGCFAFTFAKYPAQLPEQTGHGLPSGAGNAESTACPDNRAAGVSGPEGSRTWPDRGWSHTR